MKQVLVVYDSKFGNTKQLANYIAEGIGESGIAEAIVIGISEIEDQSFDTFDGILFGAPVHAFRATRGIKGAVKKAAKKGLDGKLVGAFETYQALRHAGKFSRQIEGDLQKKAKSAKMFSPALNSLVDGYEGSLNEAEPAKGKEFGQKFSQEL